MATLRMTQAKLRKLVKEAVRGADVSDDVYDEIVDALRSEGMTILSEEEDQYDSGGKGIVANLDLGKSSMDDIGDVLDEHGYKTSVDFNFDGEVMRLVGSANVGDTVIPFEIEHVGKSGRWSEFRKGTIALFISPPEDVGSAHTASIRIMQEKHRPCAGE